MVLSLLPFQVTDSIQSQHLRAMNCKILLLHYLLLLSLAKCTIELEMKPARFRCLSNIMKNTWWGMRHVVISGNQAVVRNFAFIPHILFKSSTDVSHLEQFLKDLSEKPSSYTIIAGSISDLQMALQVIVDSKSFQIAVFSVFLTHDIGVEEAAQALWNFKLPNSIIFQADSRMNELDIYVIQILDCGQSAIAYYVYNLKPNAECTLIPEVPHFNFRDSFVGCPLRIIWFHYPPFVYPRNHSLGWKGIFIDFLEPFGQLSGREITYGSDDSEYYLEIMAGYAYESVREALQNETQLFVGMTTHLTSSLFHLSPVIMDNNFVIISPKPLANYWSHVSASMPLIVFQIFTFVTIGFLLYGLNRVGNDDNYTLSIGQMLIMWFGIAMGADNFRRLSSLWVLRLFIGKYKNYILLYVHHLIFFSIISLY